MQSQPKPEVPLVAGRLVDFAIRFWRKVRCRNGCWVWTGDRQNKKRFPYGLFYVPVHGRRRRMTAHKYSYLISHGIEELPEGLEVGHACHNSLCVRPTHLELTTHPENVALSLTEGRRRRAA